MTLQIYLSPLVGALFALVLYIAFMSGILEASIFPKFSLPDYHDFQSFVSHAVPVTGADAAKAIFWSFVAGFMEQFVPAIIAKFAKEGNSKAAKPKDDAGGTATIQVAAGLQPPSPLVPPDPPKEE